MHWIVSASRWVDSEVTWKDSCLRSTVVQPWWLGGTRKHLQLFWPEDDPDEADEEGGLATSPVWPDDWPHFEDSAKVDKSS